MKHEATGGAPPPDPESGIRGEAGHDDSGGAGVVLVPPPRPADAPAGAGETSAAGSGEHSGVTPLTHDEIAERRSKSWGGW